MTRKKSNVKALALAVTCAILAGGYSGLNPVYAADTVNVNYDNGTKKITAATATATEIKELVINGVHIGTNSTSGTLAAEEGRIEAKNIRVGEYLRVGTQLEVSKIVGLTDSGTTGGIVYINGAKFVNDGKDGAITASSLKLTGTNGYEDVGTAIKNNAGNISTNKAAIGTLEDKTKKISYDASSNTTTVNGIKFHTDTSSDISDINDGIIKFSKNGAKDIVQINSDLMFNDNAGGQAATLTLEGVRTLNGLSNGGSKIEADDGSVVGGVTFDSGNITGVQNATVGGTLNVDNIKSIDGHNEITVADMATTKSNTDKISYDATDGTTIDGNVMVNKGDQNQVKITDEGIVVGLNSTVIGSDGVYAGGHTEATAKAVLGADGSIKGAGNGAGNYNFTVDSSNGTVTINDAGNVATISGGGISIADASGSDYLAMGKGTVLASASVISPKFFVDSNNAFEKNSLKVGDGTNGVTIADGEITTTGNATVGGDLSVAGTSTFTGKTTFSGGIKTDTIEEVTADKGVTVDGVLLKDGGVNASAMSVTGATGSLNVKDIGGTSTMIYTKAADGTNTIWIDPATGNISTNGTLQVGGGVAGTKPSVTIDGATGSIKVGKNDTEKFAVDGTTGNVKTEGSLEVASNATVGGNIKGQSLNIGATGTEFTVDTVGHMTSKSAQIGSVGITNTGVITGVTSLTTGALTVTGAFTTGGNLTVTGDLEASGAIKGKTISITDGGSIAGVDFATGGKLTATTGTIAGVNFATGGVVSGVNDFTSTIIRDGAGTIITNGNVESKTAKIGAISIDNEKIEGSSANGLTIENVKIKDGVVSDVTSLTADKATIGGVNTLDNIGIKVATGSTIQVGVNTKIEDGSIAVSTNTKLTDQALNLNATNTWTAAGGLVADKATVNGVVLGADATQGKATFTDAASKVTTIAGDTITTGTITAGELLVDSISLGKDPANKNITIGSNGDIKTNGDITVTGVDGDTTVIDGAQATFGKDAMNQTIINKGDISATAKNAADAQQSTLTHNNKGFKVEGKDASGTKASSFGFDTSTGIGTFTGQDGTTTAINGSNLTLDDGTNSTALNAGGATFTGAAGEKGGTQTTINGGTITTDTLNVERINLGGEVIDKGAAGVEANSKLYMDAQGNFRAAGGNFKVNGADGAMTNTVGNTTLKTDNAGASMNYAGTANSNISVADGKAEMAVGANAAVTATDGKVEIKGGTQTVTTTDAGTVFANGSSAVRPGGVTTTTINGNEITTGKLTTDQLVITGSGAAAGTGSGTIALGGDGSIKSNIKDGNDESTFETKANNIKSEVTDGTYTATHNVAADKIGSVITGGTVELRQELDANTGKITNKAGDMSTELDNNGFTVKQNGKTDVKIADGDVTVTNDKNTANPGQEVHLSDLGSLNNLDGELKARDEYQDNKTAVGAINAEAAIRREEVARLDNRIDDVNNRVDKVGAMAAAIASLKSIGYDPQAPSEFSIGLGQYKGETGVAMGFFHYPNKNFMINVSLSTAGGETMGGIGATWRFGHKSPQKLLDEQREAQARKELAAAEKYQAAAKLAKEAQERAEYAAKLARQAQVSADNAKAAADATQAKHFQ